MIEFEIKSKVQPIGTRKGQTVYFAQPKSQQYFTNKMLSNVVCEAMTLGMSVDLAELGSFRLVVPSKMMDTQDDVTVAKALKTPKIVFTPKQKMRDAANAVELSIDRSGVKASTGGGTTTEPGEEETDDPLA